MFETCTFLFDINGNPQIYNREKIVSSEVVIFAFERIPYTKNYAMTAFRTSTNAKPKSSQSEENWRAFRDPTDGFFWWYSAKETKKGISSEIVRSAGQFTLEWSDGSKLVVFVQIEEIENCLELLLNDFKGQLSNLIVTNYSLLKAKFRCSVKSNFGQMFDEDKINLLESLVNSIEQLLPRLKTRLFSKICPVNILRAKPSSSLLVQRLKKPFKNIIFSHAISEDWNTGENRFICEITRRALLSIKISETLQELSSSTNLDAASSYAKTSCNNHKLKSLKARLIFILTSLKTKGISPSDLHYNAIIFQQNPYYNHIYNLQKKFFNSIGHWEIYQELSELANSFKGVTNIAQVYERWCLISIITELIFHYKFIPEKGWLTEFLSAVLNKRFNISITFQHNDFNYKIRLTYEKQLNPNDEWSHRPDFVLELIENNDIAFRSNLVLDAKFRTKINNPQCEKLCNSLAIDKNYSEDGKNMVFILQPASFSCTNFGLERHTYHGWLYAFPMPHIPQNNISLVILEWLQLFEYTLDYPSLDDIICPKCGASGPENLKLNKRSKDGKIAEIECQICWTRRIQTRCYQCKYEPLFKNGNSNYFQRKANNNIICPCCGYAFEENRAQWNQSVYSQ